MKTNSNEKIIKYLNENHPGWSRWEDIKKNMLSDPKTKEVYDALEPEFALKALLLEARAKKGMTQKKLAEKLGTKQSAIARFESGKTNPTFDFINKLAI
ncbi:MAG: helix-turn-helix transcriptional regulator, partial [Candidatus Paceibacterota bacterium]